MKKVLIISSILTFIISSSYILYFAYEMKIAELLICIAFFIISGLLYLRMVK